jgi:pSer/pThr/pTyr-binding forkhead associated (FHA) protein
VFTVPQGNAPSAWLHVTDPDGHTRRIVVGPAGITIGRANDNGLVARDVQVSRHHGRIVGRRGTLIYEDLGSTNGSRVNGELVTEVVLGVGDRLEIGGSVLVLEGDEEAG